MSSVRPIARDASPTRSTMRKDLVTRDVISSVVAWQIAWIALFRRFRGCGTTSGVGTRYSWTKEGVMVD